ncbi:MAG TPA: Smr/MutS family protein [Thermoanaerobaculia bacterium]|nr:Smr/MutS family protein [Thermoanaerobaculia bacterium]
MLGEKAGSAEASRTTTGPPRLERRLRRETAIPARLDLHGCDRNDAVERLRGFLREVARRRPAPELVLVIHGKGARVLARAVRDVLDADPRVAEHVQAPRRLGGEGARVARLRSPAQGSRRD